MVYRVGGAQELAKSPRLAFYRTLRRGPSSASGSADQRISGGWCSHGGAQARREQREEKTTGPRGQLACPVLLPVMLAHPWLPADISTPQTKSNESAAGEARQKNERPPSAHAAKRLHLEKKCRFCWAAGRLLGPPDGVWGRKGAPRGNGRKFNRRAAPGNNPPVFRSQSAWAAALTKAQVFRR
jgi:hypothetical protein